MAFGYVCISVEEMILRFEICGTGSLESLGYREYVGH
jgi:hypothetical protein